MPKFHRLLCIFAHPDDDWYGDDVSRMARSSIRPLPTWNGLLLYTLVMPWSRV